MDAVKRSHLQLVPTSTALRFEREVATVLREISPEGSPPSPEAQRWSFRLLLVVMCFECAGGLAFGGYVGGFRGSLIGLAAVIVLGLIRCLPILIAASARRKDRLLAEQIVRERWEVREQFGWRRPPPFIQLSPEALEAALRSSGPSGRSPASHRRAVAQTRQQATAVRLPDEPLSPVAPAAPITPGGLRSPYRPRPR